MEEMRNTYKIVIRKTERRDHLRDLGIDWKMILKWITKKEHVRMWKGFI